MTRVPRSSVPRTAKFRANRDFRRGWTAKLVEPLVDVFESRLIALMAMVLLLGGCAVIYVVTHLGADERSKERITLLRSAIAVSDDGWLRVTPNIALLEKYFAPVTIANLDKRLRAMAEQMAQSNALERGLILEDMAELCRRGLSTLGPLQFIEREAPAARGERWNAIQLFELQRWFSTVRSSLAPERETEGKRVEHALIRQLEREDSRRQLLKDQILGLESAMSFDWLRLDGAAWVWEVVMWTIFGAIANTLIKLFKTARANTYSADEFVLVFPKLVLAPLISIVVIALWSSGVSNAPITYLNLPLFLVVGFSLGFATEQLYDVIHDTTGWVVSRFSTVSREKADALGLPVPYEFLNPPAPPDPQPGNLAELARTLHATAHAEVERQLVTQLSRTR